MRVFRLLVSAPRSARVELVAKTRFLPRVFDARVKVMFASSPWAIPEVMHLPENWLAAQWVKEFERRDRATKGNAPVLDLLETDTEDWRACGVPAEVARQEELWERSRCLSPAEYLELALDLRARVVLDGSRSLQPGSRLGPAWIKRCPRTGWSFSGTILGDCLLATSTTAALMRHCGFTGWFSSPVFAGRDRELSLDWVEICVVGRCRALRPVDQLWCDAAARGPELAAATAAQCSGWPETDLFIPDGESCPHFSSRFADWLIESGVAGVEAEEAIVSE